ncbi:MAG: ATP-binding protein [Gammaproteobacteria bacterium]|nr:ATP-binding protein [Gammaproteobacteria bacterium]
MNARVAETQTTTFQADSALLRELGERLVGQAHIALAELVKNAYDADASRCHIEIRPDEIVVADNGHGMSETEFLRHWMTIGTRHKERNRGRSRRLKRNVTGSKGVGRLAAQFLARRLEIVTVARTRRSRQLFATVDWDKAINAGKLTKAKARYRVEPRSSVFAGGARFGTRVVMKGLKQEWGEVEIRDLGRELWMIQSPIGRYGALSNDTEDRENFEVELRSTLPQVQDAFDAQMQAALKNYMAMITGEVRRSGKRTEAHVRVSFGGEEQYSERFSVSPLVNRAKWEIRVFKLAGKQAMGIAVQEARDYFAKFGGVKVYDAGFRLPYYGVDQDWLGIEYDHSHRMSRSALLPERLQVRRALYDLPTQGRLFGVVDIDTGSEARNATDGQRRTGEFLKIQVTRDRLVANKAYLELARVVRWSLDYYATRQRLREQTRAQVERPTEAPKDALGRIASLVQEARKAHPGDDTLVALQEEVERLVEIIDKDRVADEATRAMLGPLASAGMVALALEHDTKKEMRRAREILGLLGEAVKGVEAPKIRRLTKGLQDWMDRTDRSRRLFSPLLNVDDREEVDVLSAGAVLEQVVENVEPLIPGMTVAIETSRSVYLPPATFAEWNSLLQNVLVNAANATLDCEDGMALCEVGRTGRNSWIRIHDNGGGVDLTEAKDLFDPFARRVGISEERLALGLGGTGLGLTIVRMIAEQRNARVTFVKPTPPWSTTFQLSWRSFK